MHHFNPYVVLRSIIISFNVKLYNFFNGRGPPPQLYKQQRAKLILTIIVNFKGPFGGLKKTKVGV